VIRRLLRSKATPAALRAKLAWDILESVGATGPAERIGETDPERLRGQRIEAERQWARWSYVLDNSMPNPLTRPDWAPLCKPADLPEPDDMEALLARMRGGAGGL
jgi:hypothetical protein